MKHSLNLFVCFLLTLVWGTSMQAQDGVNFNVLQTLVDNNDDERDPGGLKPGGSGGGDSNVKIFIDWPDTTKMISKPSRITWTSSEENGPFKVSVIDASKNEIHVMETQDTSALVPLKKLNLKVGEQFTIQVSAGTSTSTISFFTMAKNSEYDNLMKALNNNPKFIEANYFTRMTMKAFALEVKGFNYNAYKFYKTYMFDDKQDMTLRNLRDRFRKEYKIFN